MDALIIIVGIPLNHKLMWFLFYCWFSLMGSGSD